MAVRACYSARTNDRNVIIGTVAATCNERGGMENIPETKRKRLMRQAERRDTAGEKNKEDGGKERAAFVSDFQRRRNVSYVTCRHCIYCGRGVCAELAYRLSRNQSAVRG